MDGKERPRRPMLSPDAEKLSRETDIDPAARRDAAHASAASVLRAGRDGAVDVRTLLELEQTVGLEELCGMWRDTDRASLPSTLWTLYLLRAWCHRAGPDVVRLWHAGRPHAEVAAAVAGLPPVPTDAEVGAFADSLLAGVFAGDLSTSLHRAAGFFRVIAAARADLPDTGHAAPELGFGALTTAQDLERAADAWHAGALH